MPNHTLVGRRLTESNQNLKNPTRPMHYYYYDCDVIFFVRLLVYVFNALCCTSVRTYVSVKISFSYIYIAYNRCTVRLKKLGIVLEPHTTRSRSVIDIACVHFLLTITIFTFLCRLLKVCKFSFFLNQTCMSKYNNQQQVLT